MPWGAVDVGVRPRQHQVVALGVDGHLVDLEAVVVGLDGGAELARGDPVVGELDGIWKEAHLGRAKLEAGLGAELVALVEGERLGDEAGRLQRDAEHGLKVRAGDVDVDLAPAADPAAEERGLAHEAEGAGLEEHRPANGVDQLAGAVGLDRDRAHEGLVAEGHEEEALNLRRLAGCRVGPGLRLPERLHGVLDRARDAHGGLEIVAGRRQQDAEHEVAVAGGQVVEPGQQQPRDEERAAANHDRHRRGARAAAHHPAGEAEDDADEQRRGIVDNRQAEPVRRFLLGGVHPGGAGVAPAPAAEDPARERGDDGARHDEREDDRD